MDKIKLIIIGGPTASGKSGIAVDAAKLINGEVISCDSMQIYKGMDIGTAKISAEEMCGVPHYMIDVADPKTEFSAYDFSHMAEKYIKDIVSRGKIPVIVGGTGLYVESLIYPLSFIAKKDESVRARLYEEYLRVGAQPLYERLQRIDPDDAAKIHPNNVKRLLRALEIAEISGKTKSECAERIPNPAYDIGLFIIDSPREQLYKNIDARVDKMFEDGIVNEVKKLISDGVDRSAQSMQAIGYKEFKPYFEGSASLEDVKEAIKHNTRRYAKRQITWFKRYTFGTRYSTNELDKMLNDIKIFAERKTI